MHAGLANGDIRISAASSTLNAQFANVRSSLSRVDTSNWIIYLLLFSGITNLLLFICVMVSLGSPYIGVPLFYISLLSCIHVLFLSILNGEQLSDALSSTSTSISPHSPMNQLSNALRMASSSCNSDPYLHGMAFGSTIVLFFIMRYVHEDWESSAICFMREQARIKMSNGSAAALLNMASQCGGIRGPARSISFLSGLLSWLYAVLCVMMYVRRRDATVGGAGGGGGIGGLFTSSSSSNYQYEEIDGAAERGSGGFGPGDFPSSGSNGINTIRV